MCVCDQVSMGVVTDSVPFSRARVNVCAGLCAVPPKVSRMQGKMGDIPLDMNQPAVDPCLSYPKNTLFGVCLALVPLGVACLKGSTKNEGFRVCNLICRAGLSEHGGPSTK